MIKEALTKLTLSMLSNVKIPVTVLLFLFIVLTPIFTAVTTFVQEVRAQNLEVKNIHSQLDEVRFRFRRFDALDEKVNAIMIEMGIQKELRKIESRYRDEKSD